MGDDPARVAGVEPDGAGNRGEEHVERGSGIGSRMRGDEGSGGKVDR